MNVKTYFSEPRALFIFSSCIVITFLVYHQSFFVPFYFDDYSSILRNEALLSGDLHQYLSNRRPIPHFSLWIDYQLWGDDPALYHFQNTLLHAICGFMVFILTYKLTELSYKKPSLLFAAFVTLIWLVHPLNSQPVIYIVQRMTTWMALFSLLAIFFWLKFRVASTRKYWRLGLAGIFTLCAVLSKETAIVLPLIFVLIDTIILKRDKKQLIKEYLTAVGLAFFAFVSLILIGKVDLASIDAMTRENADMTRLGYFWAQQEIVAIYLYKFFFPYPLLLEYPQYQLKGFSDIWPWFIMHIVIIIVALEFIKKAPLITFGILLYYIFHLVESSFIPISDLAFEHRSYLPNVGLTIATASLLHLMFSSSHRKLLTIGALIILLVASSLTMMRIHQWQDPFTFYQREHRFNPQSPRVLNQLGTYYFINGDIQQADRFLRQAFLEGWRQDRMTLRNIEGFIRVLFKQGDIVSLQRLVNELEQSFADNLPWQSHVFSFLASLYIDENRCDLALPILEHALTVYQDNVQAIQLKAQCL